MTTRRRATPPAAIDDLVTRLQALLPDVDVADGLPVEIKPDRTRVYVINVEDLTRSDLTQQGARIESYLLGLFLQSHALGAANRAVSRDAWWDLLETIEQQLFDDPELGLADDAGVESVPVVNTVPDGNQGWTTRGTVNLRVTATI